MNQITARIGANGVRADSGKDTTGHFLLFVSLCLLPLVFAWDFVYPILNLVLKNDTYTHIPLIPLVSAVLIYSERNSIFSVVSFSWKGGLLFALPGAVAIALARVNLFQLRPSNQICLVMFGLVLMWIGAFSAAWGTHAEVRARFSLLFLLFMVPIPEPLLSKIVFLLQEGSAKASAMIFNLYGVPFLQNDLVFSLPGIAIRVAEECSGIRSTLALMIMTVLASRLYLRTFWKQFLVCLLVIPLSILKNGLRIATLSTLAAYVDESFLTGPIHHQFGGMIFFGAAFIPLAVLFWLLRKSEKPNRVDQL